MPVEPPATPWAFPSADSGEADLVAVGADLAPGTVLAAYRRGLFPMAVDLPGARGAGDMAWWSPDPRGVLPLSGLRVTRSMRQSARHFEIRVDSAFAEVVAGCANPDRAGGWIDDDIAAAYVELHRLGWAHSVEAWRDGVLVGGLYGVAIGGLFAGESMFTRVRDASKVALTALVDLLTDEYADDAAARHPVADPAPREPGRRRDPACDVPRPPRARPGTAPAARVLVTLLGG